MFRNFLAVFVLISTMAFAGINKNVELKPVHEALVTKVQALAPIELIATQPPPPKVESPPPQPNPQMIWIAGYWAWDRNLKDYVWVCGIWRLPPENHQWISGYWKQDNGWWWVGGYWQKSNSQLVTSQQAPPSNPEENAGNPPNDNSFWAPGYWNFDVGSKKFNWLGGSWQPFDDRFVFVPAFWQYRPEGYVFHPAFWDWALDERGVAYDCNGGSALIPLAPEVIISRIYAWYPDYHIFFWFHWHCCHHDFWHDCWCLPPWWGWGGWWTLSWHNTWWVWWWWGHPGFPAPPWMWPFALNAMMGPGPGALFFLGQAPMPIFITPNGIPSLEDWLDAIEKQTGNRKPLIPEKDLGAAAEDAGSKIPPTNSDRPNGQSNADNVDKPSFDDAVKPQGTAPVPSTPAPPQSTAPIPPRPDSGAPQFTPPPRYTPPSRDYEPPRVYPPRDRYRPIRPIRPERPYQPNRPLFPPPQWERPNYPSHPDHKPPSHPDYDNDFKPPHRGSSEIDPGYNRPYKPLNRQNWNQQQDRIRDFGQFQNRGFNFQQQNQIRRGGELEYRQTTPRTNQQTYPQSEID